MRAEKAEQSRAEKDKMGKIKYLERSDNRKCLAMIGSEVNTGKCL